MLDEWRVFSFFYYFYLSIDYFTGVTVDGEMDPKPLFAFDDELVEARCGLWVTPGLRDEIDHEIPNASLAGTRQRTNHGFAISLHNLSVIARRRTVLLQNVAQVRRVFQRRRGGRRQTAKADIRLRAIDGGASRIPIPRLH